MQAITSNHLPSSGVKIFKSKEQSKKLAKSLPAHDDFDPTSFSCVSQFSPGHVFVLRASSRRPSQARLRPQPRHCISSPPLRSTSKKQERLPQGLLSAEWLSEGLACGDSSRCCESLAFLELRQLQRHTTDKCNTGKAASA